MYLQHLLSRTICLADHDCRLVALVASTLHAELSKTSQRLTIALDIATELCLSAPCF